MCTRATNRVAGAPTTPCMWFCTRRFTEDSVILMFINDPMFIVDAASQAYIDKTRQALEEERDTIAHLV
jgi:hypothetical protein